MNRRHFLQASLAAIGALSTSSTLGAQLQLASALSAARFTDYKAIICIFLYGGHDSFNLVIPTDGQQYTDYANTRQSLAYAQEHLVSLSQADTMPLGMHENAAPLAELFNTGQASVISNIGPMVAPAQKSELLANDALLPPQLFSHNDQQALWQNGVMDTGTTSGWGGRMADLLMDSSSNLPLSFSLGGTNLFQSGRLAQHYVMNTDGVEQFGGLNPEHDWNDRRIAHHLRILAASEDIFSQSYASKMTAVRENNALLSAALANVPDAETNYWSDNKLARQLKTIAKVMSAQAALGQNRQIFFASLGGFDTHDDQATQLPLLQKTLAEAMAGFQADITARGLANSAVTFTQSEFGRTLTSNGDGTDHGWAGHQIIMGNPIQGGRIFGHMPEQVIGNYDDYGDGRIIPTTSIEQFGSQVAQWFGLGNNEILDIFPHLNRFDELDFRIFG
ncbi:DUF1501 domain-containing protein [Opacimonas viscosa]|uniref:DUF1501 domain-containing protein n=1 Tax=Opacimonas viscosa TaxID=2961944 RepID=A0AA41X4P4_9ALTE|nr:DUF1501 domain-containing protein [Opacimonas viscosa]MCP3429418.1 DUF1501 domain-containing protein [Opacimonas viscosa]